MKGGMPMVISVWNCRATVSRRVDLDGGAWTYESASNWEELENEAIDAVENQGGAVNISSIYPCPIALGDKAKFD